MNGGDGWVNDKAVPLLSGAPPQVRERDHGDCHADDIDETPRESKPADVPNGSFGDIPPADTVSVVRALDSPPSYGSFFLE
jgi:hypothetical protein